MEMVKFVQKSKSFLKRTSGCCDSGQRVMKNSRNKGDFKAPRACTCQQTANSKNINETHNISFAVPLAKTAIYSIFYKRIKNNNFCGGKWNVMQSILVTTFISAICRFTIMSSLISVITQKWVWFSYN